MAPQYTKSLVKFRSAARRASDRLIYASRVDIGTRCDDIRFWRRGRDYLPDLMRNPIVFATSIVRMRGRALTMKMELALNLEEDGSRQN
jgi:hypothetical protein